MPPIERETVYGLADAGVKKVMDDALDLFKYKNRKYDNAIERTGLLGATVEIIGAVARLPAMVLKAPRHGRGDAQKLRDVLLDILVYSAIAVYMMTHNNWEGE